MSARFEPPFIQDNPTGWGPNTIPAQFKDMVSIFYVITAASLLKQSALVYKQ